MIELGSPEFRGAMLLAVALCLIIMVIVELGWRIPYLQKANEGLEGGYWAGKEGLQGYFNPRHPYGGSARHMVTTSGSNGPQRGNHEANTKSAAVMGFEKLVPGNKSWPSPTSSIPRSWEFSSSPCDLAVPRNANTEGGSQGVGNRGRERLSASWQQERANSSRAISGEERMSAISGEERLTDAMLEKSMQGM